MEEGARWTVRKRDPCESAEEFGGGSWRPWRRVGSGMEDEDGQEEKTKIFIFWGSEIRDLNQEGRVGWHLEVFRRYIIPYPHGKESRSTHRFPTSSAGNTVALSWGRDFLIHIFFWFQEIKSVSYLFICKDFWVVARETIKEHLTLYKCLNQKNC